MLSVGERVLIQDPTTLRWDIPGTVLEVGPNRDYLVRTTAGKEFRRNRRHLLRHSPTMPGPGAGQSRPATYAEAAGDQRPTPPAETANPEPTVDAAQAAEPLIPAQPAVNDEAAVAAEPAELPPPPGRQPRRYQRRQIDANAPLRRSSRNRGGPIYDPAIWQT